MDMYADATTVIRNPLRPVDIPDWWSCHDWGPTFAHSGAMMAKQLISPLHRDLNKSHRAEGGYDHLSFDELQLCVWQRKCCHPNPSSLQLELNYSTAEELQI